AAEQTALIICDVWDSHWSKGATERVDVIAPRINDLATHLRNRGSLIIHAPSETLDFYRDHPARRRMDRIPCVDPPEPLPHADPPLPIDDSDGGSDSGEQRPYRAWSRQHPAVRIADDDLISDDGIEICSALRAATITTVAIAGVHTNMCVLNRSFGIKNLVRWGLDTVLVRDLTDAMYNPAMPPYVSHQRGTELVIEYIEKYWCPTVTSTELLRL
ncbi:MAG: isochorismatase family protein, partial [Microlunatus sp.]|nr:isochorismatase family protein [Microlunatus sp.]